MLKPPLMKSPASRIALSAALSLASMTVPAVHADDDPTEAPAADAPPPEDPGVHSTDGAADEITSGDALLIEFAIEALIDADARSGCKAQCCHTNWQSNWW